MGIHFDAGRVVGVEAPHAAAAGSGARSAAAPPAAARRRRSSAAETIEVEVKTTPIEKLVQHKPEPRGDSALRRSVNRLKNVTCKH